MNRKSTTYHFFSKAVAVFLIMGILFPSALQAKHLVDFCMMEMAGHHEMMDDSHDCCLPEATHHSNEEANNHHCDNGTICACPVDEVFTNTQFRVPVSDSSAVIISKTGFNFSITSPDEFIHKTYFAHSNPDAPPLYLLYGTFLN